ncbi:hypothetical protein [Gordonia sp. FQ]|uniref:hypothetical protein n=1 Tax=Gordonia sp. FQ TaxID=3446634 RepID=UPI003F82B8AE
MYRAGTCEEESTVAVGIDLKTVSCAEASSIMTVRYKITRHVDSANVPNRTDAG